MSLCHRRGQLVKDSNHQQQQQQSCYDVKQKKVAPGEERTKESPRTSDEVHGTAPETCGIRGGPGVRLTNNLPCKAGPKPLEDRLGRLFLCCVWWAECCDVGYARLSRRASYAPCVVAVLSTMDRCTSGGRHLRRRRQQAKTNSSTPT